ncbi:hypothetical protein ACWEN3_00165 [Streptomyces sp. NPDC004561]
MAHKDTGTHGTTTVAVQVRVAGDADEEAVAYIREKIDAVLGRPGVPAVSGGVRVTKAVAHHTEQQCRAAPGKVHRHMGSNRGTG